MLVFCISIFKVWASFYSSGSVFTKSSLILNYHFRVLIPLILSFAGTANLFVFSIVNCGTKVSHSFWNVLYSSLSSIFFLILGINLLFLNDYQEFLYRKICYRKKCIRRNSIRTFSTTFYTSQISKVRNCTCSKNTYLGLKFVHLFSCFCHLGLLV